MVTLWLYLSFDLMTLLHVYRANTFFATLLTSCALAK